MQGSDDKPATLTIEEWLLAKNIDWLRDLYQITEESHAVAVRTNRLKQVNLAVLLVVFVLVAALQWQIYTRNERLDELEQVTRRVDRIATEVQNQPDNTEFTDRVLRGLDQIDRLCQQQECEP